MTQNTTVSFVITHDMIRTRKSN